MTRGPAPQAATPVRALALDRHTRRRVLAAPAGAGRLHSAFRQSVNLLWHDGRLVTLHGPGRLLAPFAIALESWDAIAESAPGAAVQRDGLRLHVDRRILDLEPAREVDLSLKAVSHGPEALLLALAAVPPRPIAPGLASTEGQASQARLRDGIRQRDAALLLEGVSGLVGLGEGLTPAGDDCLVGALAVLHAFAAPWLREVGAVGAGIAAAARGTTLVARDFLLAAVEGRFAEALLRLCGGAPADARHAAAALLEVGGTSGADTLSGVHLALEALVVQSPPVAPARPWRRFRT
jgi:hypothetical protein